MTGLEASKVTTVSNRVTEPSFQSIYEPVRTSSDI